MILDLDYSLCNAMKIPFKSKRLKRVFGKKPNQFKFKLILINTKRSLFKRFSVQINNLINKIVRWIYIIQNEWPKH